MKSLFLKIFASAALTLAAVSPVVAQSITHKVEKGETLYGISKLYGVAIDDIIRLNPEVRSGVKTGQTIIISQGSEQQPSATESTETDDPAPSTDGTHTIAPGETLYRIARANGLTVDELLRANPQLDALNYSAGTVVIIPEADSSTKDDLIAFNPGGNEATKNSDTVNIPKAESNAHSPRLINSAEAAKKLPDNPTHTEGEAEPAEPADEAVATGAPVEGESLEATLNSGIPSEGLLFGARRIGDGEDADSTQVNTRKKDNYLIGLVMPFMLREGELSADARRSTDFYRGFLLAADSISPNLKAHFDLFAYDTNNDNAIVNKLLERPEMAKMDVIIGPSRQNQFDAIARALAPYDVNVLNMFLSRDDSYLTSSNVIQSSILTADMYDRAIDGFLEYCAGRTPVFLVNTAAEGNMAEFTTQLRQALTEMEIPFQEIKYDKQLTANDLAGLSPNEPYTFVPASAKAADFKLVAPQLVELRKAAANPANINIFGYPEWLTFREDLLDNLNTLDAMAFSRYFCDASSARVARVNEKYRATYGEYPRDEFPSTMLLGFDTGWYLLSTLSNFGANLHANHPDFDGLQIDFRFDDEYSEGLGNTSLVLVKFSENAKPKCINL